MEEVLGKGSHSTRGPGIWLQGARPRTLAAWRALAAMVVSVAIQVGVNYANDYSDGIRGSDTPARLGPVRLTASGLASPARVRRAAAVAFALAALAGLSLAVAVDLRLLLVGVACILAAMLYTGGPRPYGYAGFGELAGLVFFGLVATVGTAYVQLERVSPLAVAASFPVCLGAVAILLANNIRDLDGD